MDPADDHSIGKIPPASNTESQDERVLGEVLVIAKLAVGVERLRLIFTSDRIIFAHVGKRAGSAAPLASMAGFLAAGLEDLFKGGRESARKKKLEGSGPTSILRSDPDNFSVKYNDIVRVELAEDDDQTSIMLLSKDDKLQMRSRTSLQKLREMLVNVLGDKLFMTKSKRLV